MEGLEYESHYGDMRTDIQEVRIREVTAPLQDERSQLECLLTSFLPSALSKFYYPGMLKLGIAVFTSQGGLPTSAGWLL